MARPQFSIWKRAIFRKVKEIKDLSGGVVLYAAQSNPQIDVEIAEKGRFRTKRGSLVVSAILHPCLLARVWGGPA
jgi:hypothetical protein